METTTSRTESEQRNAELDEIVRAYDDAKAVWRANPATTAAEQALRDGERLASLGIIADAAFGRR